jgi:hypothetical protein
MPCQLLNAGSRDVIMYYMMPLLVLQAVSQKKICLNAQRRVQDTRLQHTC